MDDLISSFAVMAWDPEDNYNQMTTSILLAHSILHSSHPSIDSIITYLDLVFSRYSYMNRCISFNYDIDHHLQDFLRNYYKPDFYSMYNVSLSYDIDNAINDLL
jgi:hypothetical protein